MAAKKDSWKPDASTSQLSPTGRRIIAKSGADKTIAAARKASADKNSAASDDDDTLGKTLRGISAGAKKGVGAGY
jgi:hypothetical protein